MAHTVLSESDLPKFANNINLDESTSSSDAGDVLIRATRIHYPEQSYDSKRDNVKITVNKLRDFAQSPLLDKPPNTEKQNQTRKLVHRNIPPAMQANLPSVLSSDGNKACIKSQRKRYPEKESKVPYIDMKVTRPPSGHQKGSKDNGQELLISRYAVGGKEAVLAALKQRSQTAPLRREVKVQFLDQRPAPSLERQPASVLSGDQGTASTAAVLTAAAIAATAPLLKAQSDMEVRVTQVSDELRRLVESDWCPGKVQEARASGRVIQLEEQLNALTQQRLQHLEWVQSQQMELQNRLLGSALGLVTAPVSTPSMPNTGPAAPVLPEPQATLDPSSHVHEPSRQWRGGGKSPLETPAPRRVIPKPTCWNTSKTHDSTQQLCSNTQKTPGPAQGNGRLPTAIPDNSSSSLATRSTQQSLTGVAIATPADGCQRLARSREGQHQQQVSDVPSGVRELVTAELVKHCNTKHQGHQPGLTPSSGVPEPPSSAVKRANDMLQDLGRFRTEMQTLLQAGVALPAVDSRETFREKASAQTSNATSAGAGRGIHNSKPPTTHPPLPCVSMQSQEDVVLRPGLAPSRHSLTLQQKSQPCPSMFEDAERVLRQVRLHKKTLEENLQAMLRAKDGETLHSQFEALSCNRDTTKEVRIKKTVDAWINALSEDIQVDIAMEDLVSQRRAKVKGSTAAAIPLAKERGTKKDSTTFKHRGVKGRIQTGGPPSPGASRGQTVNTEGLDKEHTPDRNSWCGEIKSGQDAESYLVTLYGKALYEGRRRTLKKGPYLRYTSPSPKSKAPRPRVVESVRGVKMKSSKTQTSLPAGRSVSTPMCAAAPAEPQYIFSPTRGGAPDHPGTLLKGYLMPVAIPLGQPRVDGFAPQPSCVLVSDRPLVVTPSDPPRPARASWEPNAALLEVKSDRVRRRPQLQIQVQPSVSIQPSSPSSSPSPVAPADPPPDTQPVEGKHEEQWGDDEAEDNGFPGTHFLEVADITQDPKDVEAEEVLEGPIELNGRASPPAAMYHGPAFPFYPVDSLPPQDPVLSSIQHRATLENRLVDWVEQQLMARMILEMYRPPVSDPAQDPSPAHSETHGSVTSDIVEAAGGEGLQLFVDAGVPVDSELIRRYVNEALAETVALMLGERGADPPVPPASSQDPTPCQEPLVPTPVPTPEPSVSPGSPSRGLSPLATPQTSEWGTPEQSPRETQPPDTHTSTPPEPVTTPVSTPVPTNLAVSPSSEPPDPWGQSSLPLAEEQPHSPALEQKEHDKPLVMSVAEEEPDCVASPVPPVPSGPQTLHQPQPTPPPPHPPGPQTPSSSSSSSSSSSEESSSGSSTVTETDTAHRHISEGELLLSYSQVAAARLFEEEGCYVPYGVNSFCSSLHEVQDMDYDPPSEGQVRMNVIPTHHDPFLALLAKMDQGVVNQARPDPEGSWEEEEEEEGEVSEGQRPRLRPAGQRQQKGRSLTAQPRTGSVGEPQPSSRQGHISSGRLTLQSGASTSYQDTQRPVRIGALDVEQEMPAPPHPDPSVSPPPPRESISQSTPKSAGLSRLPSRRPAPILVRRFQETNGEPADIPGEQAQLCSRAVAVRLPSSGPEEEEEVSISLGLSTKGGETGDTDSSGNDVF
ncbi:protein TALPID3 isoform X1 [Esox lucius]|uniref:Protein TALPID3 n=1 Tax=Esox lucius TaxID=8010 RepID=A0A3P8ZFB0_ESOLU|nr:protein TALPID3 isoform X1 [Esox lucius]